MATCKAAVITEHNKPLAIQQVPIPELDPGSLLVKITARLSRPIVDDLPFGYQVFVDDGSGETQVFVAASTGINPFNIPFLVAGDELVAVGYSGQFLGQYEVLPRRRGDIRRAH